MPRQAPTVPGREEFTRSTEPFRRELLAHCYRMLGSLDEAEDLVQETFLRAWRSHGGFEGRSSLRVWLYRIATNACLTALEQRGRRALPSGLGAPCDDPAAAPVAAGPEVSWLGPIPDALVTGTAEDPAAIAVARESLRLGLIACLQYLPARQRAVLILRDVLAWRAPEVASVLGTSTAAVKSSLQRARARLDEVAPDEDLVVEPEGASDREVLDRYMAAFEHADMDALLDLLQDGVELEMPPNLEWFHDKKDVLQFLRARGHGEGRYRMLPTRANGQPAVVMYVRGVDGVLRAHSVQVLTVEGGGVARITAFIDVEQVVRFGFPRVMA